MICTPGSKQPLPLISLQLRVADATGVRLVAELHMVGFDRDDREGRDEG